MTNLDLGNRRGDVDEVREAFGPQPSTSPVPRRTRSRMFPDLSSRGGCARAGRGDPLICESTPSATCSERDRSWRKTYEAISVACCLAVAVDRHRNNPYRQ